MEPKKTWQWKQPSGDVWTVETDKEKGTVTTKKKDGTVILERTGLKPESVTLIEQQFMSVVGNEMAPQRAEDNPMYA